MENNQLVAKKISVIIPVYNVENYIDECLQSVLKNMQLFEDGEVEVILINDGSTDQSEAICKNYANHNAYVNLYSQANAGLSAARNNAISKALGEYIFFLDSDDKLADSALRLLYDYAAENGCEITQCGMLYYFGDNRDYVAADVNKIDKPHIVERGTAMKLLIENDIIKNFACGKLYQACLIKNELFPIGKYFEDMYWQHNIINKCSSYGIIGEPLYIYRQRESSISGKFSLRRLDMLKGYECRLIFIQNNYPNLTELIVSKLWHFIVSLEEEISRNCSTDEIEHAKKVVNVWKSKYTDLFRNNLSNEFDYKLYRISPRLFELHNYYKRIVNRLQQIIHLTK